MVSYNRESLLGFKELKLSSSLSSFLILEEIFWAFVLGTQNALSKSKKKKQGMILIEKQVIKV
jgi:hypothetical protein